MDGHINNSNHKDFKESLPHYEKGENSKQKSHNKVNYTYTNDDDVINMAKLVDFEYYDIIIIKGKKDDIKPKILFVLRSATSTTPNKEQSKSCASAITGSCTKIVLKGPVPFSPELDQHKDKPLADLSRKCMKISTSSMATNYSILDQLQQTSAQITIFELLKILPTHR